MIGYVTIGTNNLERAVEYYDALFASIDVGRFLEHENYFVAWAPKESGCGLSVTIPFDKKPATVGNGVMVAILLDSPEKVDAFYEKALELGGASEGAPGFRPDQWFLRRLFS